MDSCACSIHGVRARSATSHPATDLLPRHPEPRYLKARASSAERTTARASAAVRKAPRISASEVLAEAASRSEAGLLELLAYVDLAGLSADEVVTFEPS